MKKRRWTTIAFTLISALHLMGCLPEPLEVNDIPQLEKEVVIGSQNLPGEFLVVTVTEPFDALAAGEDTEDEELAELLLDLAVDNLDILVFVNEEPYPLFDSLPGLYIGLNIPQIENETYTMVFQSPFNDRNVVSTTRLLPQVRFDSLAVGIRETPFDTLINVDFKIQDPPGRNWYMINVQTFNSEDEYDILETPFTKLIEDKDEARSTIEESFTVPFEDYEPGDSVVVTLSNITEDYHRFLEVRKDQRFNFLETVGEPVNYPSNVQNGLGFFHLHVPDVRVFLFN